MRRLCLLFLALLLCAAPARAQDLEPRAYSPSPVGINIALVSYLYSSGGVVTDPSVPVQNVDAKIHTGVLYYGRTFGLLGRSASASIILPYVWGRISGDVGEERREITRAGMADLRMRFAMNLFGTPALSRQEFAARPPQTTLGASLTVGAPSGQYDEARLINLGTNRWAFKPEIGLSHPVGHWVLDLYAGAWFFTANDDFFGGVRRTQQPIGVLQGHVSYIFRPGLWLAADGTWYSGGQTTVDGVHKEDLQKNTRVGATLAVPLGQSQSVKLAWATGATTRLGQDFDTYALAWQYRWPSGP